MIKINNTDIQDVKINNQTVSKVIVDNTVVWPTSGPGPLDYVQDGLVFLLDGIDKGDNEGYWTDLVGNVRYDISNAYRILSDCIQYNNTPSQGDLSISALHSGDNSFSYEICAEHDPGQKSTYHIIICNKGDGYFSFGLNPSNNRITAISAPYHSQYVSYENVSTKNTICYAFNNGTDGKNKVLYINSEQKQIINSNRGGFLPVLSNGSSVGGSVEESADNNFYGKIYAIRIYNRKLTEEEILHNQQLDIQRFGLNIQSTVEQQ